MKNKISKIALILIIIVFILYMFDMFQFVKGIKKDINKHKKIEKNYNIHKDSLFKETSNLDKNL